jgi:hypothetical protein
MPYRLDLRPDLTDYETVVPLDGRTFLLRFRWSEREVCWYADLHDDAGVRLAAGIKVLPGTVLAKRRGGPTMPDGVLLPVDTVRGGGAMAIDSLGDRVQIVYLTAADLAGMRVET